MNPETKELLILAGIMIPVDVVLVIFLPAMFV